MTAIKTMMERQSTSRGTAPVWVLCLIGAALLVTSASVHIYYYNLIYKNVATIGNLFLVQIVASFILALALVLTRHVLVVLASAGLMAGTVIGFILVGPARCSASTCRSPADWPRSCWSSRSSRWFC